jgi:hypothetical protein
MLSPIRPRRAADELPLPAIVHWQGDHWIVLYRVEKNHVRVADPESGLRRYKREEFLEDWTGYASVISYGEGLEQQPAQKLSLGWIKPFLRPYLKLLGIATFLAFLAAGLELVLPILTARIVDNVLVKETTHKVDKLWVLMGLIAAGGDRSDGGIPRPEIPAEPRGGCSSTPPRSTTSRRRCSPCRCATSRRGAPATSSVGSPARSRCGSSSPRVGSRC